MPVIAIGQSSELFPALTAPYHVDPYPSPPPSDPATSPPQADTDQVDTVNAVPSESHAHAHTDAARAHVSNNSIDSGVAFARSPVQAKTTPLPTQPLPDVGDDDQGEGLYCAASGAADHTVPPPAQPRRHRSGVLMSRVRSCSRSGGAGKAFMSSKSFGDLNLMGLQMSSADAGAEDDEGDEVEELIGRRVTSEGSRSGEVWDNSARFYHHLHSRPASRQTSPERRSSTSSPSGSPIYVRRATTLPKNVLPASAPAPSAILSPNQAFLHSHFPPIFNPSPGTSPDASNPHMVVLTPTTAEWKELKKEMGTLKRVESSDSGDSKSSDEHERERERGRGLQLEIQTERTVSRSESTSGSASGSRPRLKPTMSVDYLSRELVHTPDPGAPPLVTNIIAPSPSLPSAAEMDDQQPTDDSPQRFASIGRRESLRALAKPSHEPKKKTKREMERERLFKDLDEELALDQDSPKEFTSVTEIGGIGFGAPAPPEQPKPRRQSNGGYFTTSARSEGSLGVAPQPGDKVDKVLDVARTSPTQPIKPSPLHASPVNALSALPSPTSALPTPPTSPRHPVNLDTIRNFARQLEHPHSPRSDKAELDKPGSGRRRDTKRVSLVAGRVVQPFAIPPSTALPDSVPMLKQKSSLNSFSPFRSPTSPAPALTPSGSKPVFPRLDSTISVAASTAPPSEPGTPGSETAGGMGGRGIDDYVILSEAGKGAYGLVMRAKVKGKSGEPVGDEVIIKYIVKARILADCWKKHKSLGPIPVEIHVMDQLRHLMYITPAKPLPWDPARARHGKGPDQPPAPAPAPASPKILRPPAIPLPNAESRMSSYAPAQKYLQGELRVSPDRGHPNICKLLDFFEDREFYYMVMPRFGSGLDLFDRVEACPDGLSAFEIRSLIGQLADAVRFLHANGIVHRDIKDENVILDGEGRCQLIDFGSAAHWRPGKRWDTFSGTLHYASPEILRGEMYGGKEQDVYALGTVMYVLLVGETPFGQLPDEVLEGLSEKSKALEALVERCKGDAGAGEEGGEEDGGGALADAEDLVKRCLELEAPDRPTAEQVCQHRFLKGEGGWVGRRGWKK